MLATTNDFISHVAAHAGVPATLAECAARVVLAEIGGYLSPGRRQFVCEELPPPLGAAMLSSASSSTPIEKQVMALGTSAGRAHELIASVCRVLAEELSTDALAAILAAVPTSLARLIVGSGPGDPEADEPAPPAALRPREALAGGWPGSQRPVSCARPARHSESIAADNPHAATKLSSAQGVTQERRHETLAEGRPGSASSISGSPR